MPRLDRLWYEIDAETKGFDEGILQSGNKLKAFTEYAKGNPIAVLGALGAAALVAGYKLEQMAAKTETAMRKISAASPSAARDIGKVRAAIDDLGSVSPRARADLEQAAILIAKIGGGTATEIATRLQAAVKIADAASTDLNGTVEAMDFVMDAFGLTVDQATDALARMFAITQGRIEMDDLFTVLQRGGTTLATLGVKAEDVATALTALVDAGVPTKQAGTVLVSILEQLSAAGKVGASATDEQRVAAHQLLTVLSPTNIAAKGLVGALGELAKVTHGSTSGLQAMGFSLAEVNAVTRIAEGTTRDTRTEAEKLAAAYRALDDAAVGNRTSAEALEAILKNDLITALTNLGTQVLPIVNAELKGLVGLIDKLSGRTANAQANNAAVTTVNTIANALDKLSPARRAEELRRLEQALNQLGGTGPGTLYAGSRLTSLNDDQVRALFRGLEVYSASFGAKMSESIRNVVGRNVQAVTEELQRRGISLSGDPAPTAPKKTVTPGGTGGGLTEAERKALRERQQAIIDASRDALAAATKTLSDDLELQLDRLYQQAADNFTKFGQSIPPDVEAAIEQLRERLTRVPVLESLSTQFDALTDKAEAASELLSAGYSDAAADVFDSLQQIIGQTQAEIDLSAENTDEHRKLLELLKKELELRNKIAGKAANAAAADSDDTKSHDERVRALNEQARKVEQIGEAAVKLANAFGLVNDQTAQVLNNIVDIAANLPGALAGDPGSIVAVAGSFAQLIKGAFGESARDADIKRLQKENTEALEKLASVIGEFSLAITGKDFSKGATAGKTALGLLTGGAFDFSPVEKVVNITKRLDASMAGLGVSMDDLRKLAGQLGITLDERNVPAFLQSLKQVVAAIQEVQLTQFAETFTGQLEALNAEFQLFDISDPIAQLKKLVDLFDNPNFGAPALRDALAGLDLSTPEGRAAAEQAIQNLFTALQNGTLSPAGLGGLTPQEFLDQLLKLKQLLDAGQAANGDTGTGGYNVDRTITEATGSHITGLLTTANVYAQRSMLAVEAIADYLARATGGGPFIQPPAIGAGSGSQGGVTIVIEIGSIGAGVSDAAAQAIGQGIGAAAAPAISKALGRDVRLKRYLAGSVVLNA